MYRPKHLPAYGSSIVVALLIASAALGARPEEPPEPMALQGVMQQLGRDMQAVTGAISKEDWAMVAELAPIIARHSEPPMSEKLRILRWLGTDAGKFRGFDGQVHEAAITMGEAAGRGDGEAVIASFAKVQQSCLGCHQIFRKPFVEHFYGKR